MCIIQRNRILSLETNIAVKVAYISNVDISKSQHINLKLSACRDTVGVKKKRKNFLSCNLGKLTHATFTDEIQTEYFDIYFLLKMK